MLNGNHRVIEYFESYFVNFSPDYFDGRFEWLITESLHNWQKIWKWVNTGFWKLIDRGFNECKTPLK